MTEVNVREMSDRNDAAAIQAGITAAAAVGL